MSGSVEIAGGVVWSGGYDAGTSQANRNVEPAGSSRTPLTLFDASGQLRPAVGFEARLGVYLSPRVVGRRRLQVTKPTLRVSLSNDFESAPNVDADEQVTQYVIDGTLVYQFVTFEQRETRASSLTAVVATSASWTTATRTSRPEANSTAAAGCTTGSAPARQRLGLRVEGRLAVRNGSVDLSPDQQTSADADLLGRPGLSLLTSCAADWRCPVALR